MPNTRTETDYQEWRTAITADVKRRAPGWNTHRVPDAEYRAAYREALPAEETARRFWDRFDPENLTPRQRWARARKTTAKAETA